MLTGLPSWFSIYRQKQERRRKKASGGGGPKPKTHIAKIGKPGRHFPKYSLPRMKPVIIKTKFNANTAKSDTRIYKWLWYCTRQKELELDHSLEKEKEKEKEPEREELRERSFFNQHREDISLSEAARLIRNNKGERVSMHTMILSAGDREVDPKEYARDQMSVLEKKLGHKLIWVANVHRDTGPDKEHINVTIAGKIPDGYYLQQERDERAERVEIPRNYKLDLEKVQSRDKIVDSDGQMVTKYDSVDKLKEFDRHLKDNRDRQIEKEEYRKLWHWIGTKERHGENAFGKPPVKYFEIDYQKIPYDEMVLLDKENFSKYDSIERLERLLEKAQKDPGAGVGKEEQTKIESWLHDKRELGEDYFGQPPLREPPPVAFQRDLSLIKDPIDRMAAELTGDKVKSVSAVQIDKALDAHERYLEMEARREQQRLKSLVHGDVYIDRNALSAMRERGNQYVHFERQLDRTIELEIERMCGRDDRPREQERLHDRFDQEALKAVIDRNMFGQKNLEQDKEREREDDSGTPSR